MTDTPRVTVPRDLVERVVAMYEDYRKSDLNHACAHSAFVGWQEKHDDWKALSSLISAAPAPEGGAVHYGDPCIKCGVGHDNVPPGPCRGDGITISRERATEILDYLKKGSGPAGWPTTLWCEVQAFIANIEAALATREEAPAEAGDTLHPDAQPFEQYPELALHIERMAMSGVVGSMISWDAFLRELNAALRAQPPARSGESQ